MPDAALSNEDGTLAVSTDGAAQSAGCPEDGCCETGCPFWWKADRCQVPGCPVPESIYVCSTAATALPDGSEPRPVRADDVVLDMGHCWRVLGDAGGRFVPCPPNTPPPAGKRCLPAGAVLLDGTGASPIIRAARGCADDLCVGRCYVRGRLCPGQTQPGELCVVFPAASLANWFGNYGHSCAVGGISTPGYNGGATCFYADRSDTGSEGPGSCVILDGAGGMDYLRSCCICAHDVRRSCETAAAQMFRRVTRRNGCGIDDVTTQLGPRDCCCSRSATKQYFMEGSIYYSPPGRDVLQQRITVTGIQRPAGHPDGSRVVRSTWLYDTDTGEVLPGYPTTEVFTDPLICHGYPIVRTVSETCAVGVEEFFCDHYLRSMEGRCYFEDGQGGCIPNTIRCVIRERCQLDQGGPDPGDCVPCADEGRPFPGGGFVLPGGGGGGCSGCDQSPVNPNVTPEQLAAAMGSPYP